MDKNNYALRIANATPNQLNIITFEICIDNIKEAIENIDTNRKISENKIDTAILTLREIITSLNHDYEIAEELYNIYIYVNKILIQSKFKNNTEDLQSAILILTTIKEGFEQIDDVETDSVMKNATKVFAGLTYGKGGLSEYIDESENRGFKA